MTLRAAAAFHELYSPCTAGDEIAPMMTTRPVTRTGGAEKSGALTLNVSTFSFVIPDHGDCQPDRQPRDGEYRKSSSNSSGGKVILAPREKDLLCDLFPAPSREGSRNSIRTFPELRSSILCMSRSYADKPLFCRLKQNEELPEPGYAVGNGCGSIHTSFNRYRYFRKHAQNNRTQERSLSWNR